MTRRDLLAAAAAGSAFAKAPMPFTTVNFEIPKGACDCHTHIFADPAEFPFAAQRSYTPEPATAKDMARFLDALKLDRVVIVTPSVYGTDNRATLHGMKELGPRARGVAVIDERTPESDLDAMHKAGIRGIRLNLFTAGVSDPKIAVQRLRAALARVAPRRWHVQLNTTLPVISALKDVVLKAPVPVVFDHFGGARAGMGTGQPGFANLVELVRSGKAYVKVSGAYRASDAGAPYVDAIPLAQAFIAANPDRVLWGTDWPHPNTPLPPGKKPTDVVEPLPIDDGIILNQLAIYTPETVTQQKILADNPARLYGF